jgi:hypothetical protein
VHPLEESILHSRRHFLTSTASGVGALALSSMLEADGLLGTEAAAYNPMARKAPHFDARAKSCIFIFLAGAPSQIDLYDPKPKLVELHGQPLPESMSENVRFAFISAKTARLKGSPRKFTRHGQCGMELSDRIPHLATCADDIALVRSMHTEEFNHHPGQLMMNSGVGRFGRPSVGSWVTYGLGSESNELPGYVVLSAGVGSSGGTSNWTSGFLPSTYQGVAFRGQGDPILNLKSPPGVSRQRQREGLEVLSELNRNRLAQAGDEQIASRIASYELAFRMQMAAPELMDLSGEKHRTLEAYGIDRTEPENLRHRGYRSDAHGVFARNCLHARRLVERGVRFINLYHASWDHHDALDKDLKYNCSVVDQPIAALIKDLKERGLLDSTLVVCTGEFGRTPLADTHEPHGQKPGRDHHPFGFSLWMAGGGVPGGQVIGQTDELGWAPVVDPVHINDFHATLLHLFGLNHLKLTKRFGGLDLRLTDLGGKVVGKLLG